MQKKTKDELCKHVTYKSRPLLRPSVVKVRQEKYKMLLKKGQLPIFIVNLVLLIVFGSIAFSKENYEFIGYLGVIIFFFVLILATNKKHNLSNGILWGLTTWALMHMIGGLIIVKEQVVYKLTLINLIETSNFVILRYDQFVHMIGFGVATLIAYSLLKSYLNKKTNMKVLSVLIILIGMGCGAFNEIIEFIAVLSLPETGVGGYYNTMFDMVFNTIGAILAIIWINIKKG